MQPSSHRKASNTIPPQCPLQSSSMQHAIVSMQDAFHMQAVVGQQSKSSSDSGCETLQLELPLRCLGLDHTTQVPLVNLQSYACACLTCSLRRNWRPFLRYSMSGRHSQFLQCDHTHLPEAVLSKLVHPAGEVS